MNLVRRLRSLRALVAHDRVLYGHVGVTHRCNMRCRMCAIPLRADASREAPPERFGVVARELADLGCMTVSLDGSEPFMRKDLPKIVEAFAREDIRVRVLTNGVTATPSMLKDVASAGARDASISIDSLDPVIQAEIEDRPDVFPHKFATLAGVIEYFPAGGVHIINAVVTPQTLPGLPDVARFAEEVGFFSSFIPVHLSEGTHPFFAKCGQFAFREESEAALRGFYAELLRRRKNGGIINSRKYLLNSIEYLLGRRVFWQCSAGVLYVSVGPDARISICHEYEDTDSVEAEGFARRYVAGDWREKARSTSLDCADCYRPCWAEIDHLAFGGGAFLGALKIRLRGRARARTALAAGEIAGIAERILAEGRGGAGSIGDASSRTVV